MCLSLCMVLVTGFSSGSVGKESTCNAISGSERSLEEGMATHSSILAWKIPWTEEAGRLQSIRSQRVRHDWSNWACTYAHDVRKCSNSIFFSYMHMSSFSQHHLLKRLSFLIVYCVLCQRYGTHGCVGLSLGFYLVPLVYISFFVPVPYCLNDCSFVV